MNFRSIQTLVLLSLTWLGPGQTPAHAASPATRPNIVVLVADDWGFSDVGAFGGEIATPHLDALAKRGQRFSNFHVAASCSPTRAMLLTGVDNHRNGHGNLRETMPGAHLGQPGYQAALTPRVVTVASLLQGSGYRTYVAGKWNVGNEAFNLPNKRGFDKSFVMGDTGSDNWEPTKRYLPHSAKVNWFEDGKEPVLPADFYSSTFFVDKTIEYLRSGERSGKPFFAYVGFQANHVPLQAPKAYVDKYKGRYEAGWTALRQERQRKTAELGLLPAATPMDHLRTTQDWTRLSPAERQYQARSMEVYAAMAEAMDHEVGRLVAHLQSTGEYDNTVFVFLSDNGPEGSDYREADLWLRFNYNRDLAQLGSKGSYVIPGPSWASATASPLSGYKFYAGEGALRVPLIISGVKGTPENHIVRGLTHVTDITPTLLDIAKVDRPVASYQGQGIEKMTGYSLLPLMRQTTQTLRRPDEVLGYEMAGNMALFKGDFKLVLNRPPLGDGQWHLFNITKDPGETQDLQHQMPTQFAAMQTEYTVWAKANGVLPMPEGYQHLHQVFINSFVNYWIPTYWVHSLFGLVIVIALVIAWRRRKADQHK